MKVKFNEISKILCQECGYCEQCEKTVLVEVMIIALIETKHGNYEQIYVCSCCADSTNEMAVF